MRHECRRNVPVRACSDELGDSVSEGRIRRNMEDGK